MSFTKSSALAALGLPANATPDDIKKAYRRLAMKHHPDRDDGNEEAFKKVKEAYEFLTTAPPRKSIFDFSRARAARSYAEQYDPYDYYDTEDDDDDGVHAQRVNEKIFASTFKITLEQAFKGTMLRIKFANSSEAEFYIKVLPGTMHGQLVKKLLTKDKNGKDIQINIHVDIDTGDRKVTWASVPNLFSGGIEGSGDIEHPLEIKWIDIMLGRWIKYTPVDGKEVEIRVNPGIKAGSRIKVQGKGFWKDNNCSTRGDVYIKVIPLVQKISDVSVDDLEAIIAAKRAEVND